MGIIIAEEIEGINEKKLRDEFPDADGSLLDQMLERLLPECDKAIHARARAFYKEKGEAGANDLPFVDDEDATRDYYLNSPDYKNATERKAIADSEHARKMIPEIEKEIVNLEARKVGATPEEVIELQKQIDDYNAEIIELRKKII